MRYTVEGTEVVHQFERRRATRDNARARVLERFNATNERHARVRAVLGVAGWVCVALALVVAWGALGGAL